MARPGQGWRVGPQGLITVGIETSSPQGSRSCGGRYADSEGDTDPTGTQTQT